jgi:predicted HTH transcriptional regulator
MKPSAENLKRREKFLSKELLQTFAASNETAKDYFTATEDYPKAFRAGECRTIAADRTVFGILLFWKDDGRSDQRRIEVEAVKENGNWLIDKVESK